MQSKKEINNQNKLEVVKQDIAPRTTIDPGIVEQVLIKGDLSKLSSGERLNYYKAVCESVGLNPLTRPLEYMNFQGKLVLYARKDATEQLRSKHRVSVQITSSSQVGEAYVVNARATLPDGRYDEDTGAVFIGNLKGEAHSNAILKAVTKAKRRVTLSICGLGMLDETEVEAVPGAVVGEPVDNGKLDEEIDGLSKDLLKSGMSKGELLTLFTEVTHKSKREQLTRDEKQQFIRACKEELIRLSEVTDEDDSSEYFKD